MATRKTTKRKTRATTKKTTAPQAQSHVFDYLRFGESYTSLVLGIIVVIVATVLLLAFVHNRQAGKNVAQTQQTKEEPIAISEGAQLTVTKEVPETPTEMPATPTKKAEPTQAPTPTKVVKPTATPMPPKPAKPLVTGKTYTVVAGDNLWSIAEKTYKSGYNWVDIAKANDLADPSDIHVGNKLILPTVTPQVATVSQATPKTQLTVFVTPTKAFKPTATPTPQPTAVITNKITGSKYKVVHGDSLWTIAVRAYGDGYRWVDIAKANDLENNPGLIHAGNTIKIPRK